MWILWALISAILVASRRPFEKKMMNNVHHFTYGFLVQCVSLPILAAIVVLNGVLRGFCIDRAYYKEYTL